MNYFRYTTKARLDKSINTLLGILEGIAADRSVSSAEWSLLGQWAEGNKDLADRHPYNEIVPQLISAMADGVLAEEEHQDLLWLCNQMRSMAYYDQTTADIQRLQAILSVISSDGVISAAEVESLSDWLAEHEHLRKCWPFDEVDSLIVSAMKDQWIDPAEEKMLLEYFQSFTPQDMNFDSPMPSNNTLKGICAVAPEIIFEDRRFCFTGESSRASRDEMKVLVADRGGKVLSAVSPRLNYLVVGSNGNPCWAYACYGRKIEKAIQLRQQGEKIVIVHEVDFFDAVA